MQLHLLEQLTALLNCMSQALGPLIIREKRTENHNPSFYEKWIFNIRLLTIDAL